MTDRNEAMRLADEWEPRSYEVASMIRQLAERIAELEGERDQHKHTATSLLSLLADIRMACGDNGKRMQPELVEFIGSIKAERDQLRAEVERLRADAERYQWLRFEHQRHDPICHLSWKRNGDRSSSEWVNTADLDAAIDHARTTHKETE